MDNSVIVIILNAIITVLTLLGVSFVGFKKVLKALKESGDVLSKAHEIFADEKVTEEEVEAFIKELNEAQGAWKDVLASKKSTI